MLCFEIVVNGKSVCVAGNAIEQRLSIDVYRGRNESVPNIFVAGDSYIEQQWAERAIWGNQKLALGDEISIKVVDAEQPDVPIETHKINANQEAEKLTDMIVKQVASQWLDHLLRGEPVPFPPSDRVAKEGSSEEVGLFCSFCGKSSHDVKKMISGPGKVYICNECVGLCVEIVEHPDTTGTTTESEPEAPARWPNRNDR